jgi:hypothetical protein
MGPKALLRSFVTRTGIAKFRRLTPQLVVLIVSLAVAWELFARRPEPASRHFSTLSSFGSISKAPGEDSYPFSQQFRQSKFGSKCPAGNEEKHVWLSWLSRTPSRRRSAQRSDIRGWSWQHVPRQRQQCFRLGPRLHQGCEPRRCGTGRALGFRPGRSALRRKAYLLHRHRQSRHGHRRQ